jgi:hypothetical protein
MKSSHLLPLLLLATGLAGAAFQGLATDEPVRAAPRPAPVAVRPSAEPAATAEAPPSTTWSVHPRSAESETAFVQETSKAAAPDEPGQDRLAALPPPRVIEPGRIEIPEEVEAELKAASRGFGRDRDNSERLQAWIESIPKDAFTTDW